MKRLTRAQAIIKFCAECMGNKSKLVRGCTSYKCHLWGFRLRGEEEVPKETAKKEVFPPLRVQEKYCKING